MDCDHIERLKAMDEAKRYTILLEYAESASVIYDSGQLVNTRCNAVFDYLYNVSPHRRRNWNALQHPRCVGYGQNLDWRKISLIKVTSLGWNPSKGVLTFMDNPMNKLYFLQPEPVCDI